MVTFRARAAHSGYRVFSLFFVFFVCFFWLIVILVISDFALQDWTLVLIAPVPAHCLVFTFFFLVINDSARPNNVLITCVVYMHLARNCHKFLFLFKRMVTAY